MPQPFPAEILWLISIGAVWANAAIFNYRLRAYAAGDARLFDDGRRIIRAFAVSGSGLFLLMALGSALDLTARIEPFRENAERTPFDVVALLAVVILLGRASFWVFRQDGAKKLAEHRGMFNHFPSSPTGVKLLWAAAVLGVLYGWFVWIFGNAA